MFHSSRPPHEQAHEAVIQDAQNPNSQTTAEDAQQALIDNTKRAGGAAFQFNPDASPEDKAAQARSRVPQGFHHEKKPTATTIVTDKDDGSPPQYDLPSPTKSGVVPTSPTTQGSRSRAASLNEDLRWSRERTGWAPRFGYGDPDDDEGATLLDHQTMLETKLDDKWFGDWYYNAGIVIFACLATYICTILGGGLAAVFIVMAFCATYYRTSLRRVRRNFRDDVHREMAKAKLENDTETLEWINSFLVKFWPIYAPVLCDTIINAVDQVLSTATPAFLDSLRMKTFILGTKPPRLEHVKTYIKTEEDVVLMDWKFSFNPNDTADMTSRQLKNKINPKVALEVRIGKGVVSKGLDVIVEDFAFSGIMRVKLKLQIPFPHMEKAEICFLGRPTIDYVCKPLGGDTFGFDINFIPGLESFIQEQIHGNLAPIMYEPNVFPIEIAKMLAGDAVDQAIGVLQVSLHGGQGLRNPDKYPGIPDPYATLSLNGREVLGKTKTVPENANPRWNETFNIIITSYNDTLNIHTYDYNEYRKDKELGMASFALEQLQNEGAHENLQLEVMGAGRARGVIEGDIRFFPVLEGEKMADGTVGPIPESNTGIAKFTVEQAKELDGSKSLIGQLNPYAVLLLNGKEIQSSQKLKRTNNPIWPNATKELLITDRKTAKLGLVIKDDRDIAHDPIVATYQVKLDDMLELTNRGQEWYNLAQTKTGRAKMSLQWKPVALKGAMGGGGYVTPIGVMRFHFQNARGLRNFETMGKSDPYVRVLLSGIIKGRTVTWKNNLDPDFDEIVYVPVHTTREKLVLEIMDEESIGKDRSLGLVHLNASDYVLKGEDGAYVVHDEKRTRSDTLKLEGQRAGKGVLNYTVSFFPTLPVEDPAEDEDGEADAEVQANGAARKSVETPRPSAETPRQSTEKLQNGVVGKPSRDARSGTISSLRSTTDEKQMAKQLAAGEQEQGEVSEIKTEGPPKIRVTPDDLHKYESGLIVFKVMDANLAHHECYLEVLIDDMMYPSYSTRIKSKQVTLNEIGDAMVRELDVSRMTLRLMEKVDKKGEGKEDHVYAKLAGQTIDVLRQGLYRKTPLTLKSENGAENHVNVELKYLPVNMRLDPSESINNMGNLRVDVHDAADLPAADRNGFSDPYCKFYLNDIEKAVYKTEVQKKTLHPAWNESFDVAVKSRTAAKFRVECWDWDRGGGDDLLGRADINLEILEPFQPQTITLDLDGKSGSLRLRLLFKPDYVIRSRQGSSTFRGTFNTPGKIVGAPVKGVGKAGTFVGGNVMNAARGAKGIFRRKKTGDSGEEVDEIIESVETPNGTSPKASTSMPPSSYPRINVENGGAGNRDSRQSTPVTPPPTGHKRMSSFGGESATSAAGASPAPKPDEGTATFSIVSATGFEGSNLRVFVRQHTPKGFKDLHKTKAAKSSKGSPADGTATSEVHFDEQSETFKVSCRPDETFSLAVKDVHTFGNDKDLGEGMLVVSDAQSNLAAAGGAGGAKKTVPIGSGNVVVKSSFQHAHVDGGGLAPVASSPGRSNTKKGFLSRVSRDSSRPRDSMTPPAPGQE